MKRLSGFYTGIVLKKYTHKNKIALLDKKLGRIDGIVPVMHDIAVGTLLGYEVRQQGHAYFLIAPEILDMPLAMGKHDLIFLHHVLEWCYYSVRLGSVEEHVFDAIMCLYATFAQSWSVIAKNVFIFKLLLIIGCYSEHALLKKPIIAQLHAMPIDKVFDGALDLEYMFGSYVQDMHDWIRLCWVEHPYGNQFKTVSFLYKE